MPNTQMLKERMKERDVTQKDVAEALGIAAPTVSQKLNGVRPIYLSEAMAIASMLGIESGEFEKYFFSSEVA